ncbi:bacteriophage Gp15 family protein [Bacillus tropicus]|uniref:bacteriophage Gp15 family protein n=1 Tax=Bacillus cereus group TaxID=86661 RepID=UPI0021D0C321|nr:MULTISPECIES: bacteriophage Gp15 family protein [Bacillus cereus group]MCU5425455.1 bacteriophage Gp15 family protein [Bacillus tropicus]MDK7537798.1 bacteriophage Gp15 family protein [Bacillus paranthracis]MDK7560996.1 bacteriophage Gp15 family protein [Bacillus paranthracis]
MFKLTDRNRDVYHWAGVDIELNLSFDNILKIMELFDDETISARAKPNIALLMLIVNHKLLDQLNLQGKEKLIIDIFKDKLNIDLTSDKKTGEMTEALGNTENEVVPDIPIVNFTLDADMIFASFLFDYNINLFEQQGKLQWSEFLALFNNLSEKTPMKIAIHYRTCEIPKKDKHNADERKRIKKMKERYELPEAKAIREEMEYKAYLKRLEAQKRQVEQYG